MKSKEALIQRLREEKSQMAPAAENVLSGECRGLSAARRAEKERETEVRPLDMEGTLVSTPDCMGMGHTCRPLAHPQSASEYHHPVS